MKEKIGDSESKVYEGILADMGRMVINSMLAGDGQSMKGIVRMFDDDLYDAILGTYLRAGVELGSRIVVEKREASKELTDALSDEVEILRELTDLQESTIRQIEDKLTSDVAKGATIKEITEMIIDSGVFSPMRALRIARTMTGAGASRGQMLSLNLVGATHKVWLTAGDSHVRDAHAHMNGQEVGVNELFSNGARY
ncbi:MAG: phage head morphogenesis protein, partial [Proteobacteria bacterium]|nr:phage head morphogenesis protein [Pseudomonadota bacterium]